MWRGWRARAKDLEDRWRLAAPRWERGIDIDLRLFALPETRRNASTSERVMNQGPGRLLSERDSRDHDLRRSSPTYRNHSQFAHTPTISYSHLHVANHCHFNSALTSVAGFASPRLRYPILLHPEQGVLASERHVATTQHLRVILSCHLILSNLEKGMLVSEKHVAKEYSISQWFWTNPSSPSFKPNSRAPTPSTQLTGFSISGDRVDLVLLRRRDSAFPILLSPRRRPYFFPLLKRQ